MDNKLLIDIGNNFSSQNQSGSRFILPPSLEAISWTQMFKIKLHGFFDAPQTVDLFLRVFVFVQIIRKRKAKQSLITWREDGGARVGDDMCGVQQTQYERTLIYHFTIIVNYGTIDFIIWSHVEIYDCNRLNSLLKYINENSYTVTEVSDKYFYCCNEPIPPQTNWLKNAQLFDAPGE